MPIIGVYAPPRPEATDVASVRAGALRREAVALLDESAGGSATQEGATTETGERAGCTLSFHVHPLARVDPDGSPLSFPLLYLPPLYTGPRT
jgi:hypothetical protein